MTEQPITAKTTVPVVCIEDRSGRDASLVEGTVGGRPAVSVEGVRLGLSPTLNDPIEVDGVEVFAGQSCVMLGKPVCDMSMYVRRGERRYFLYWGEQHESASAVPSTTQAVLDRMKARGLVAAMRDLDLDDASAKQLVELSNARRSRSSWNLVKFVVGASLQVAAPKLGVAESVAEAQGKSLVDESLDVTFEIDESEKPILAANPKLAATFRAAKLAAGSSDYKVASLCTGPLANTPP